MSRNCLTLNQGCNRNVIVRVGCCALVSKNLLASWSRMPIETTRDSLLLGCGLLDDRGIWNKKVSALICICL